MSVFFFSMEDYYDLDIKYRKLIQDDCTLLTCEQSFSKVLVRVGQGEKNYGSTLTFKEICYDLQLRPKKPYSRIPLHTLNLQALFV